MKRTANATMLLAFGLVGCSGCGDKSTPSSGPTDAGGLDAPSDAAHDALDDVRADATDSAVSEGGTEGGGFGDAGVVDEGEWVRSPFSDFASCTIEQPKDLSTVTKAEWLACPGNGSPCQMLDAGYLPGAYEMKINFISSVTPDGNTQFAITRGVAPTVESPTVYSSAGDPVASWRFSGEDHCGLFVFRVTAGRLGVVLTPTDAARQSTGVTQRVLVGTPTELLAGLGEHYDLLFNVVNLNGVENLSFSDSLVVADGQPGGRLLVATRPSGTFEEVPKQGGKLWDKHALVGSELIASADDDLADLYIRHPDGSVALLKGDPSRAEGLPGADGSVIAWQEGSGGTLWSSFQHMEVWAAPFTTDPATFQPHKAADLPNMAFYDSAFGEGWCIVRLEAGGARFVHLADSRYVDVAPPQGLEFTRAVGVASGEAWFLMRASPGSKYPVTIARYDLASIAQKLP